MKNTIRLVTHDHCLDGATCGVLGLASGMDPDFVYPDGAEAYLRALPDDEPVVLADISFPVNVYPSQAHRLVALIDHHQSALPLQGLAGVHLSMDDCASTLLYRWLLETGRLSPDDAWLPLLKAVNAYDLWLSEHQAGQNLNRLFHDLGWEWFRDKFAHGWVDLTADEHERLARLMAEEQTFVRHHVEKARHFQAAGHLLALVTLEAEGAVNEVAQTLLLGGVDGVIMIKPDGRISCRTTTVLDAAKLMEAGFEGGGHPRAAGGRLPSSVSGSPQAADWVIERLRQVLS